MPSRPWCPLGAPVQGKQSPGFSAWLDKLTTRAHHNLAVVALANKLARMAWAVLARGEVYRPLLLAVTKPEAA
jgi:transposase